MLYLGRLLMLGTQVGLALVALASGTKEILPHPFGGKLFPLSLISLHSVNQ